MCQRPVNPKFSLFQLSIRAHSENKTEDLVYRRSVLLSRLAPLNNSLYIVKDSSNVSLIRDRFRTPNTFQTKFATKGIGFQQLTVV